MAEEGKRPRREKQGTETPKAKQEAVKTTGGDSAGASATRGGKSTRGKVPQTGSPNVVAKVEEDNSARSSRAIRKVSAASDSGELEKLSPSTSLRSSTKKVQSVPFRAWYTLHNSFNAALAIRRQARETHCLHAKPHT